MYPRQNMLKVTLRMKKLLVKEKPSQPMQRNKNSDFDFRDIPDWL